MVLSLPTSVGIYSTLTVLDPSSSLKGTEVPLGAEM